MGARLLFSYVIVGRGGDAIQVNAMAEGFRNVGCDVVLSGPVSVRPYQFGNTGGILRNILRHMPWWLKDMLELFLSCIAKRKSYWWTRRMKFDGIIHRATIYDCVGCFLKKKTGLSLVVHLDAPFGVERQYKGEGILNYLHKLAMRNVGRCADLIVTMSEVAKAYYISLGIPEAKILVVPNGIDRDKIEKGAMLYSKMRPFTNGDKVVLGFLGSLGRWHRVDLLLEALRDLNSHRPGMFSLIVVGMGEQYNNLLKKADILGIGNHVEWTGALDHDKAFEEVAKFDIAILPHTLDTGAPIKLFEYGALARPVLAPDLPNISSLFERDKEIRLFEPESVANMVEEIENMADKKEASVRQGLRMQERVKRYTWENIVSTIISRLLSERLNEQEEAR